jgi:uncharacterized damage-inducible protein DinB
MPNESALRQQVVDLLTKENAHAGFEAAIKGLPANLRGRRPKGAEHSAWEILEHMRIAQHDILDFSVNAKYKELAWPADYWPKTKAPASAAAWNRSVQAFRKDLKAMCALVADESTDLFAKIPHGNGQTILREALLIADHNAYHLGELVLLRRLLGAWHKS